MYWETNPFVSGRNHLFFIKCIFLCIFHHCHFYCLGICIPSIYVILMTCVQECQYLNLATSLPFPYLLSFSCLYLFEVLNLIRSTCLLWYDFYLLFVFIVCMVTRQISSLCVNTNCLLSSTVFKKTLERIMEYMVMHMDEVLCQWISQCNYLEISQILLSLI